MASKLQHSEIRLRDFHTGWVIIESTPGRAFVQLQFNVSDLMLYNLSVKEAHTIGNALVEHALECGYDPVTGETKEGE